jgi:hypothetical protein
VHRLHVSVNQVILGLEQGLEVVESVHAVRGVDFLRVAQFDLHESFEMLDLLALDKVHQDVVFLKLSLALAAGFEADRELLRTGLLIQAVVFICLLLAVLEGPLHVVEERNVEVLDHEPKHVLLVLLIQLLPEIAFSEHQERGGLLKQRKVCLAPDVCR